MKQRTFKVDGAIVTQHVIMHMLEPVMGIVPIKSVWW